jgi:hypothetical protein
VVARPPVGVNFAGFRRPAKHREAIESSAFLNFDISAGLARG